MKTKCDFDLYKVIVFGKLLDGKFWKRKSKEPEESPANIAVISVTLEVLKLDKFNSVSPDACVNIVFILVVSFVCELLGNSWLLNY